MDTTSTNKRQRVVPWLLAAVMGLTMVNCAKSSKKTATQSCVQRLSSQTPDQTTSPTVLGVCDGSNRLTVVFSMFKNGSQVNLKEGDAWFALARLVPNDTEEQPKYWQSYINRIEDPEPGEWPNDDPELQATTENRGALEDLGNGIFAYTFAADIRNVTHPTDIAYVPEQTHRVGIEFRGDAEDPQLENPTFTWIPSEGTSAVTGAADKRVVMTESCNECHGHLEIHGGARTNAEYCVLCHNPGTTDANSGNTVNFSTMIHKIHRGTFPRGDYTIWGYNDGQHDYSHSLFPQDQRNCRKCHNPDDEETPDAGNFRIKVNSDTCTSCHNNVVFEAANGTPSCGDPNPAASGTPKPPYRTSADLCAHTGGAQADSSRCLGCHGDGQDASVDLAHATIYKTPNNPLTPEGAVQLSFEIVEAEMASAVSPTVTFRILADGEALDIKNLPANLTLGNAQLRTVYASPEGTVDAPADWNNRGRPVAQPAGVQIGTILAEIDDVGGNTFKTKVGALATAPTDAVRIAMMLEGHPTVKIDGTAQNFGPKSQIMSVKNPRRELVDIDKCNVCHERLALHGNNRVDEPLVCVTCHNPNATDISVRPGSKVTTTPGALGIDGKLETPIDFREMIHAIHAGASRTERYVVYGFRSSIHEYSNVVFPNDLKNCNLCHIEGTYAVPIAQGALATTVLTLNPDDPDAAYPAAVSTFAGYSRYPATTTTLAPALANPLDDLNKSPTGSACTACHDSAAAKSHAQVSQFFWSTDLQGTDLDSCATCHGESGTFPVSAAHGIKAADGEVEEAPALVTRR